MDGDNLRFRPRETVMALLRFLGLRASLYPLWKPLGLVHSHKERRDNYEDFPPRARRLLNYLLWDKTKELEREVGRVFTRWQINRDDWR